VKRNRDREFVIERADQLAALASPARQEVVDGMAAAGPCAVSELAAQLGRPADSLYYHVRKLESLGMLVRVGERMSGPRAEVVYDVPGRPMRLRYRPRDARNRSGIVKAAAGVLRLAHRDFRAGLAAKDAVVEGPRRNVWCGRYKGWVTAAELEEINGCLDRICRILNKERGEDARLHSFACVLAPVAAKAPRRGSSGVRGG
jgi:hypothetical protein